MIRLFQKKEGFTLVELMIVIAVLSILMAISIPNYINFQRKAKAAEAKSSLGAIRRTLFAHYAEYDNYNAGNIGTLTFNTGNNQGTPFGDSTAAIGDKMPWDYNTAFSVLGFNAEGSVYYNYSMETNTLAGVAAAFTVMASADLDKNGLVSHYFLTNPGRSIGRAGDAL